MSHITGSFISWIDSIARKFTCAIFKISYLFLTLLLVMGVLASFSASDASGKSFSTSRQDKTLIQEVQLPANHHQVPVNPAPVSEEEEDQRENTDEKDYNELGAIYPNHYLSLNLKSPYWLSLRQLDLTVNNRKTVSLFILFHTWKSYLS